MTIVTYSPLINIYNRTGDDFTKAKTDDLSYLLMFLFLLLGGLETAENDDSDNLPS